MREMPPIRWRTTTAAEFAELALAKHLIECRECGGGRSDSRCGLGERYLAATNTSNHDLPGYAA